MRRQDSSLAPRASMRRLCCAQRALSWSELAGTRRGRTIRTSHFAARAGGGHSAMEAAMPTGRHRRDSALDPDFARELDDEVLAQEIKLLGDLVLTASSVTQHLTEDELDQMLGVHGEGASDAR